jgi:hypothetical protein
MKSGGMTRRRFWGLSWIDTASAARAVPTNGKAAAAANTTLREIFMPLSRSLAPACADRESRATACHTT